MIIKNGTIMDPLTLTHKKADLLIKNGCIDFTGILRPAYIT